MTILSMAENYPYRSDLLWVTEPDHPDWIYRTGEKAKIKISLFKYGIPQDGITVNYETGSELMPSDKTGSITLKNGKAEINIGTLYIQCNDKREKIQSSRKSRIFSG